MRILHSLKDRIFSFVYYDCERILFSIRKLFSRGTASVEPREFGVNYVGYVGSAKGLGEAARSVMKTISAAGVPLAIHSIEHRWQRSTEAQFNETIQGNPYSVNIFHVNADMVFHVLNSLGQRWLQNRYNIGYWVWELESFPRRWEPSSHCLDEIWVPSDFCRAAIEPVTSVPVKTMPHAVEVYLNGSYTKSHFGFPNDAFVFLYVFDLFSHFERKNPLAVIEAFRRAFPTQSASNAILVLKFTGAKEHPAERQMILSAARGLPVKIFDYMMNRNEVYGLMSVSDCYISLHRSEGFGLTIAEAMYLGKPAMATAYSGNMQFMTAQNSMLVNYTLKTIEKNAGPYKKGNVWAEPDIDHAAELMRRVVDNPLMAREIGTAGAHHMEENFSPHALSERLLRFLNDIKQKYG